MSATLYQNLLVKLNNARKERKLTMAQENGFSTVEEFKIYLTTQIAGTATTVQPTTKETAVVHIVDLLDRSGSMAGARIEAAVTGMQDSLKEFNANPNVTNTYTSVYFSERSRIKEDCFKATNLEKVKIPKTTYGSTALYTAMVKTLTKLNECTPKTEKVLVNIYTDGGDNDSNQNDLVTARKLVEQLNNENFTITFMGTENDVRNVQRNLSIHASNTVVYDGSAAGLTKSLEQTRGARVSYMASVAKGEDVSLGFYKNVN